MDGFFLTNQPYCNLQYNTFMIQNNFVRSKVLLAFGIVLLLPVLSYLLVKGYSDDAVQMPPRYYADTIVNKIVDGKNIADTLWHQVKDISLTNQLGDVISLGSISNKVVVVDFFFTRCPSICPGMTKSMKRMQDMMKSPNDRIKEIDTSLVHFLSISIDPDRDSPTVLKQYADKYGVDHTRWWMVTGNKQMIYDFGIQELKLGIIDGNGKDTLFDHSPKFVLLDKDRIVRGYYNGLDSAQILKLTQDIVFLSLERDKKKPSVIIRQLKNLWPLFVVIIIAVLFFVITSIRANNKYKV